MELVLWFLLIYCLLLSFLIYVFICGNTDCHRDGFIGAVYQFLTLRIPKLFRRIFKKYHIGNQSSKCCCIFGCFRYFTFAFFIFIYVFFVLVNLFNVFPDAEEIFSDPHRYLFWSLFVLPWPWIFVLILQFVDPGTITSTNVNAYLEMYPYDNLLYKPAICKTTKLPIVPRSRYDRFSNRRIAGYDHYCPWVLSAIGRYNHRFFFLFLLSCLIAASYYLYCNIRFLLWVGSFIYRRRISDIILELLDENTIVFGTSVCLLMVCLTLAGFVVFHLRNISFNIKTIEFKKYESIKRKRKLKGDQTPVNNFYNRGFRSNWKEFLFPEKPKECEPYKI